MTGNRRDGEEIDRAEGSRPALKYIEDEEETAIERRSDFEKQRRRVFFFFLGFLKEE